MNGIRKMYNGQSSALKYIFIGLLFAVVLGLASLRVSGYATTLSYMPEYTRLQLRTLGFGSIGAIVTLLYLFWISVGVWRYFIRTSSIMANFTLILGLLHLPISILTILVFASSAYDGLAALIKYSF